MCLSDRRHWGLTCTTEASREENCGDLQVLGLVNAQEMYLANASLLPNQPWCRFNLERCQRVLHDFNLFNKIQDRLCNVF